MNRITLKFRTGFSKAQLDEAEFYSPLIGRELVCCRGQSSARGSLEGTFLWTGGVLGMSALFVLAKMAVLSGKESVDAISSDISASVKSFDSSLSKQPQWILDMFGVDSAGRPLCYRIFRRKNPEQKRPGPVQVLLNTDFLPPSQIRIFLDDEEVRDVATLSTLVELLGFFENLQGRNKIGDNASKRVHDVGGGEIAAHAGDSRVLLPFLDHYILELSGYGKSRQRDLLIEHECRMALRVALLMYDSVYVPAVSYIQSPLCRKLLDEHRSQAQLGAIRLIGDATNWDEFLKIRKSEYGRKSHERRLYSSHELKGRLEELPLYATAVETTRALHGEWEKSIQDDSFQNIILSAPTTERPNAQDRVGLLRCAADDLGSLAFIGRHLQETLAKQRVVVSENRLTRLICDLFFSHFQSHAELDVAGDLAYGYGVEVRDCSRRFSFGTFARSLRVARPTLLTELERCPPESIWDLKGAFRAVRHEFV